MEGNVFRSVCQSFCPQGVCLVRGVFIQEDLPRGGSVSRRVCYRGVCIQWVCLQGGRPTRGGLHPGGWGLHPTGGVCTKGGLSNPHSDI